MNTRRRCQHQQQQVPVVHRMMNSRFRRRHSSRHLSQSSASKGIILPLLLAGTCTMLVALLLVTLPGATRADWIDPDTPKSAFTTTRISVHAPPKRIPEKKKETKKPIQPSVSPAPTVSSAPSRLPSGTPTMYPTFNPDKEFRLVFSDEFNTANRDLSDGNDPRWTALNKNDYTNDALHYYSPDNVWTENGHLLIRSQAKDTEIVGFDDKELKKTHVTKHFRSAMVQSWNKFCFTGGIVEAEVILPGKADVGGLWPAFWMLGNLARHTYVASSVHMWPWSSTVCTKKSQTAQRLSACRNVGHYGLVEGLGRGSPEIDIFEVQGGKEQANHGNFLYMPVGQPFASASYQVAPGRPFNRPGPGLWPGPGQWYKGLLGGDNTSLNILFYGSYNHYNNDINPATQDYWSDAISTNRQLTEDHFTKPHRYRVEWDVPTNTTDGYLHWFLDGELVFAINGTGIADAKLGSSISSEPSYLIMNTAISKQWGFPSTCPTDCLCKNFDCNSEQWQDICGFSDGFCDMMKKDTPLYKMNWVRVYQDPDNEYQKVGCSTPERPTRRYIEAHADEYKTANDAVPLKTIQHGMGTCDPKLNTSQILPLTCGGSERGRCTPSGQHVCQCFTGWTGPHCLAHMGFDPILYDQPDKITDVGFFPPNLAASRALFAGLGLLVVLLLVTLQWRHRLDTWTPIPEVDKQRLLLAATAATATRSFGSLSTRSGSASNRSASV